MIFTEIERNPKIHREAEKILNSQNNSKEKEQYLTSNYTVELLYLYKNRHLDQCNRIKYQKTTLYSYSHLIFNKEARNR
jgi:hypothetical protein